MENQVTRRQTQRNIIKIARVGMLLTLLIGLLVVLLFG